MANDTITAPKGFLAAGVGCGIKESGKNDLGLIVCPTGATATAVFTTNKITSAAVEVGKKHIKSPKIYAVVVNSGCANTCTGKLGIKNAIAMCVETASSVGRVTKDEGRSVLVASTGVIGHQLPMDKIKTGIAKAAKALSNSPKAGLSFAKAIMTTDTKTKQAVRRLTIDNGRGTSRKHKQGTKNSVITIVGVVKGAGMIAPNLATMLCFITTDAAISKAMLSKALKDAVGNSLNKLTVDDIKAQMIQQ